MSKEERILHILNSVIVVGKETCWTTIVEEVKKKETIKNWLHVRGVLQWMINQGIVKRTNSIEVEHYVRSNV
jgi:hypothetical protein